MKLIVCAILCSIAIVSHTMDDVESLRGRIEKIVESREGKPAEQILNDITAMFENYLDEKEWSREEISQCTKARESYCNNFDVNDEKGGVTVLSLPNHTPKKCSTDHLVNSICAVLEDNNVALWKRNSDLSWGDGEVIPTCTNDDVVCFACYLPFSDPVRISLEVETKKNSYRKYIELCVKKTEGWEKDSCKIPYLGRIVCSAFSPSANLCAVTDHMNCIRVYRRNTEEYDFIGSVTTISSPRSITWENEQEFILRYRKSAYKAVALTNDGLQIKKETLKYFKPRALSQILGFRVPSWLDENKVKVGSILSECLRQAVRRDQGKPIQLESIEQAPVQQELSPINNTPSRPNENMIAAFRAAWWQTMTYLQQARVQQERIQQARAPQELSPINYTPKYFGGEGDSACFKEIPEDEALDVLERARNEMPKDQVLGVLERAREESLMKSVFFCDILEV